MKSRIFILICLLLFSQQAVHSAQSDRAEKRSKRTENQTSEISFIEAIAKAMKGKAGFYLWPVFFGGGVLSVDSVGVPGYMFSGGLTTSLYKGELFFFGDALYSYRDYESSPKALDYKIEETTIDFALGAGMNAVYIGGYMQFPMHTKLIVKVDEWTKEDFEEAGFKKGNISRMPSVYFMVGGRWTIRVTKFARLGADLRFLIGQGPGMFLKKSLGDSGLGQISLGIMGGI